METRIRAALAQIIEPTLRQNLIAAKIAGDIRLQDGIAHIALRFPYPAQSLFAGIRGEVAARLQDAGCERVEINCTMDIHPHIVQGGVQRLPAVKNIIAVSSAKGGVGKSATAVNLALALAAEGANVGMLDADIYGPSLPVMLNLRGQRPQGGADGGIEPLTALGLQVMSIGFMVGDNQPMVWRGPMATRALTQLLQETRWQNLDYLVVDMPPGTGDIQLTIAQKMPVTGAIIVTTPQELALSDAQRGLLMFNKVSIPVIGVVENMSVYCCPHCGQQSSIFGSGGARRLCERYKVDLLGEVPLAAAIRDDADAGHPTVAHAPDSDLAQLYRQIAHRAAARIAQKPRDRSAAFGTVVVEK